MVNNMISENNNDKYWSRERLIWGKSGEQLLKGSKILIIGSSKLILMSELVISLSYIGVNTIKLVDDQLIDENEHGKCMALIDEKANTLRKRKIQVIKDYISNFKSSVNVECIFKSPKEYITSLFNNDKNSYNIVVCINITNNLVNKLIINNKCRGKLKSPIINLKSYGFIGIYQIYFSEYNNLFLDLSNGSKNISKLKSLQLDKPIDKLLNNSLQINIDEINGFVFNNNSYISKIPFPALILKCKSLIQSNNNGKNLDINDEIVQMLSNINKEYNYKNFIQALNYMKNIYSFDAFNYLKTLIAEESINIDTNDNDIYSHINIKYKIILSAIYDFYMKNNKFPVSNELPDIYCDSISYLEIENIYNEQYDDDLAQIHDYIQNKYGNIINIELIKLVFKYFFCFKNIIRTECESLFHIYNKDGDINVQNDKFKSILNYIENDINNDHNLIYYFLAINYYSYVDFEVTECNFSNFLQMFNNNLKDLGLSTYFNNYTNSENNDLIKW
ncbi:ubiquitin activating enzyme E1 [Cryptosporidium bovis]|uniref:ubiquitin activating enzyme E1 n=1 Tax=Cryptosporidium bovis TaxID=310047 RepID=UPI003519FD6E|nr:ubiquitin activating enzyme E1 [Cryptosporidium bovis]